MMKNIAILTGGDSAERVISLKSGQVVRDHLPTDRYRTRLIDIEGRHWRDMDTGVEIDKNDFSLPLPEGKMHFEAVFAALHGSPLEDGKMQGYFDLLNMPYTCCNGFASALTMNKYATKTVAAPFGVPMSPSVLVQRDRPIEVDKLLAMGLPLFVKPNTHGSSFGVTKVKKAEDLIPAIEAVWPYDNEALVEAFMPGREFSNGVLRVNNEIIALPVTEIIPDDEFFTFAAKYEGRSREVTPAEINPELTLQCQERSKLLYSALGCSGAVRIDYILVGDTFYLLELNTIPGISPASIIPQQAVAHGWPLGEFFALLIEEALRNRS